MDPRGALKVIAKSLTVSVPEPNPAAPSDEFLALRREGAVVDVAERDRIVKAIDAAPINQVAEVFKVLTGVFRSLLA